MLELNKKYGLGVKTNLLTDKWTTNFQRGLIKWYQLIKENRRYILWLSACIAVFTTMKSTTWETSFLTLWTVVFIFYFPYTANYTISLSFIFCFCCVDGNHCFGLNSSFIIVLQINWQSISSINEQLFTTHHVPGLLWVLQIEIMASGLMKLRSQKYCFFMQKAEIVLHA